MSSEKSSEKFELILNPTDFPDEIVDLSPGLFRARRAFDVEITGKVREQIGKFEFYNEINEVQYGSIIKILNGQIINKKQFWDFPKLRLRKNTRNIKEIVSSMPVLYLLIVAIIVSYVIWAFNTRILRKTLSLYRVIFWVLVATLVLFALTYYGSVLFEDF